MRARGIFPVISISYLWFFSRGNYVKLCTYYGLFDALGNPLGKASCIEVGEPVN